MLPTSHPKKKQLGRITALLIFMAPAIAYLLGLDFRQLVPLAGNAVGKSVCGGLASVFGLGEQKSYNVVFQCFLHPIQIGWLTILIVLFLLAVGLNRVTLSNNQDTLLPPGARKFRPALHAFKPSPGTKLLPWARNVLCTLLFGPFAAYLSYLFVFHNERLPAGSVINVLFIFGPLSLVFLFIIWIDLLIDVIKCRKKKSGEPLSK
jgi:hypothetical protein